MKNVDRGTLGRRPSRQVPMLRVALLMVTELRTLEAYPRAEMASGAAARCRLIGPKRTNGGIPREVLPEQVGSESSLKTHTQQKGSKLPNMLLIKACISEERVQSFRLQELTQNSI